MLDSMFSESVGGLSASLKQRGLSVLQVNMSIGAATKRTVFRSIKKWRVHLCNDAYVAPSWIDADRGKCLN